MQRFWPQRLVSSVLAIVAAACGGPPPPTNVGPAVPSEATARAALVEALEGWRDGRPATPGRSPQVGLVDSERIANRRLLSFEVFLEHPPLVAGTTATLAIHVTDLRTFEPRRSGRLSWTATSGSDGTVDAAADAPRSPGLYPLPVTFPKPGPWKGALRIATDDGDSSVDLPPLRVYGSEAEANAASPKESPEGIGFLKGQQWKLGTRTARTVTRAVS